MKRPVCAFAIAAVLFARGVAAETISKPDGTRFDLAPGTNALPAENNVMSLKAGTVRARMPDDGRKSVRPRIVTEAGTVMVMEGEAVVSVDDLKTTRVSVHRGRASLTAKGKTVEVGEGMGAQIVSGAAPAKATSLAIAPVWTPPERRTVVVADPTANVALPFEPSTVKGTAAASWHFQVAKDAGFTEVVFDTKAPLVARQLEATGLAPGAYHARASAIDAEGLEGKWSTVALLTVVRVGVERISGGRVRINVEPSSAKCTVDGAPVVFPFEADQHQTHDVVCGEGKSAKLVVGARPLEGVRLTTTATATGPQSGSVKVVIVDVEGQPVDRLRPVAVTPSDLAVAPLVPTGAPGEYVATYTFTGPPHAASLSLRLRPDWVANVGTVNFASWVAQAPADAPPAKDAPKKDDAGGRKGGLEIGAAGLASWRGKPPVGVGFEGELRGAFAMPHGALFIGVAGGWAKLLESTRDGVNVEGSAISMRAVIGYRFGTGVVAPYIQLGPEVLRQWVQIPGFEGREWLVGASGGLGLDIEAGPGAFFLEVRGRAVARAIDDEPSLAATGGLGLVGYRLRL